MKRFVIAKVIIVWLLGYCIAGLAPTVYASENAFLSIVHPIRWPSLWSGGIENLREQAEIAEMRNLPVTWLIHYENFLDPQTTSFFKNRPKTHELGILLEVSPKMAADAEVAYAGAPGWFRANNVFLSGYERGDREKLITTVFGKFKEVYGFYPRSVGAWHLDAYSLAFIKKKYPGVIAGLVVADQLTTDGYGVWGQYWSTPFYPSNKNALMPANSKNTKLDVVLTQWAARDPLNGYGGGLEESTYSVQTGDYERHGVDISYFKKLVNLYTNPQDNKFAHLVVGLEGVYGPYKGTQYEEQLEYVKQQRDNGRFRGVTLSEFASWYREKFPSLSPSHKIQTTDLLGTQKDISWYMSPWLRAGVLKDKESTRVIDWRIYDNNIPERFYFEKNNDLFLDTATVVLIDSARGTGVPLNVGKTRVAAEFRPKQIKFDNGVTLSVPLKIPNLVPWAVLFAISILIIRTLIRNFWLGILLFSGTATWSVTLFKSGLLYPFGMGFWGPNGHDGVWHIALIQQLSKFSLENPIFAGETLHNYHWFYDGLLALVHRITFIPIHTLYFQVFPPFLALLVGWLTYVFVKRWRKSETQALWSVFFVYFGGSLGWLVTFFREGTVGGESMFWANQAISTLINPPFAISLVLILAGLILLLKLQTRFTNYHLLITIFVFGILIQIKVYAGLLVLGGLAVVSLWSLVREKKSMLLKVSLGSLVVSLLIFLPTNVGASSLLVFSPLWFPETMVGFADRFYWPHLANAIAAYKATGNLKIIPAELLALSIFIIGNLGTRILGIAPAWRWIRGWITTRKMGAIELFVLSVIVAGFVLPMLFIQKGNPWNTIQFFYYLLFFLGILAGIALGGWLASKSKLFIVNFTLFIIILTIPTTYGTLKHYLPPIPPAKISYEELDALGFLKRQPTGAVLSYPYDTNLFYKFREPRPLYAYTTTSYVTAFSGKPSFLADEMNLEIIGVDFNQRKQKTIEFFNTQEESLAREFLNRNDITYLYIIRGQEPKIGEGQLGVTKIFENPGIKIYQVKGF